MEYCYICHKQLNKYQKTTCSVKCRMEYLSKINKGRPSPFKGKNRWSEEQKIEIGNSQKGKPKSEEFKLKCSERLKNKPSFFKGKKQTKKHREAMEKISGINHYNYKGRDSTGENASDYSVRLRREKIGFTKELFEKRLMEQNNKCAICGCEFDEQIYMKKKSADHCHTKKIPRGILCRKCNLLLGNANDSIEILQKAIDYLNMWKRTA